MPDSFLKYCLPGRLRFLFILHLAAAVGGAVDLSSIPKPTGYVSDLAHVLSASDQADLEVFCVKIQEQLDAQFAIVTINTLGDEPIENFSLDLARNWGVGPKGKNEGLLLLLVIQDHKQRIEVGRGLEPYITDAFAGNTMRAMRPLLRNNDFGGALKQGTLALATRLAEGKNVTFTEALPAAQRPQLQNDSGGFPIWLIIFFVVILLIVLVNRRGGGGRGSGTGFWTGMILGSILNSGRSGGDRWGGGGFGGGSGGGGGFGGFGGGDFGGGGASSDW